MAKRKPPPASREPTAGPAPVSAGIERSLAEEALSLIVEGTAPTVGAQFFHALVKHLAAALEVRYAFIAELVDPEGERVRLISFWTGAAYGENFEYPTKGTPCEHVVGKRLAYFPSGVQELFPDDLWLTEMGIESYLAIPLFDSAGSPLGHLGVMHDDKMNESLPAEPVLHIFASRAGAELERRQAEAALRESEERFRTLYTKTPAMVHSIDTDGNVVTVSDRWLEVLGYERNEVIGRKSIEFLTAESRQYAETVSLPEFWKTGSARDVAFQFVTKNGEIVDVLLSAVAQRDPEGNIVRTLAVLDDITERKRAEEALREAREALEGRVERKLLQKNPYGLTFREFTVLHHVATGKADKEIAHELGISPLTVHKHVANILGKMSAASRTEAASRALREGLLD